DRGALRPVAALLRLMPPAVRKTHGNRAGAKERAGGGSSAPPLPALKAGRLSTARVYWTPRLPPITSCSREPFHWPVLASVFLASSSKPPSPTHWPSSYDHCMPLNSFAMTSFC